MDLLTLLFAAYHPGLTAAATGPLEAAVHAGASSIPGLLGLCAVAGAVVRLLQPCPASGQVWVARRRDLRGIRVRITHLGAAPAGIAPLGVVLTPPPGPLSDEVAGAPVPLPVRGRRLPGFRLLTEADQQSEAVPSTTQWS